MTIRPRRGAVPRRFPLCVACAAAMILPAASAEAGLILEPGSYVLRDHPDGNQAPPTYGLRLDELINVTGDHDVFTFTFGHVEADMRLDITEVGTDEFRLHIHGTAYGGLVQDNQYDANLVGVVDIDFVYMIAHPNGSDDDLIVTTPTGTNSGHITFQNTLYNLVDHANNDGFTFQLGNEKDDEGHRGFDGISGWGWLEVDGVHTHAQDWLFTVAPTPGTMALMSIAIAICARGPRRR